jgi:methyltransferase (TIGR00027 family)
MPDAPIRDVCDTARWVAMYRALESERPDALFRDPFARRLAGARGAAIVRSLPLGDAMAWALVVRTALLDEMILERVAAGIDTVVNLGAGLDTRAYRLPLPAALRWFDVDLPAMVAHRRAGLARESPSCAHFDVAADLAGGAGWRDVLAAVGPHGRVLVVSEGLLVYLHGADVARLGARLREELNADSWLTDVINPWALRFATMFWQPQLNAAGAGFCFAPASSAAFFRQLGWDEIAYRSIWQESIRLRRSVPLADWWSAFARMAPPIWQGLTQSSGVALLAPTSAPARRHASAGASTP